MRVSISESVENYANFIKEVYHLTHKAPVKLSMNHLMKKHRVSSMIAVQLQKDGVLRRGHYNVYRWIGPEPSPSFIANLRNEVMIYHRDTKLRRENANIKGQVKLDLAPETAVHPVVSKPRVRKKRSVSIFWGLIKFNY